MYLHEFNNDGIINVSLLFRQSKMAPTHTTSTPRTELRSTVLATQAAMMIRRELDVKIDKEIYYITQTRRLYLATFRTKVKVSTSMSRTTYSLRVMQLHQISGDTSTLQEILLTSQLAALPQGNW